MSAYMYGECVSEVESFLCVLLLFSFFCVCVCAVKRRRWEVLTAGNVYVYVCWLGEECVAEVCLRRKSYGESARLARACGKGPRSDTEG